MTPARRGVQPRSIVAGLAAACLLCLTAAPAQALSSAGPSTGTGLGIRLTEAPTDRRDDPRARTYVVDQVRPGAAFTRLVEVRNDTGAAARLLVYPAPASIRDGSFVVGGRGEDGLAASWITTSPSVLELPARGTATVAMVVRVPADAPAGEVLGAVVVEQPPTNAGPIGVAVRAAVRVYLSVGEGEEPASDLSVTGLVPGRSVDGVPQVRATVRNTGGRALDVLAALTLTDGPDGATVGPVPAQSVLTLAPGQSGDVLVDLDADLPAGPWAARLDATSGQLTRSVASTGLLFPEASGSTGTGVTTVTVAAAEGGLDGGSGALAVGLAGLLAVGVGCAVFGLARRRRVEDDLADELAALLDPARAAEDSPLG